MLTISSVVIVFNYYICCINIKKYTWIFYFITATILTTIAVQINWNYKNYQENKQHVQNEIKLSLNTALEIYYSNLAKKDFLTILRPVMIM